MAAADSALAGLKGGIGQKIVDVRQQCLDVLAELEVGLNYNTDQCEYRNYCMTQQSHLMVSNISYLFYYTI